MTDIGRPVGIVFIDDTGKLYTVFGNIKLVPKGGRPKATLRHVAMTLHFEFLCGAKSCTEANARLEVAELFHYADADSGLRKIIKDVQKKAFHRYPTPVMCIGATPALTVMASLGRHPDGTVEGYAARWGDREAVFGRGTLTFHQDGGAVFDAEPYPIRLVPDAPSA